MAETWEGRIRVVQGDIATLAVGAIVNAANCSLLGGGGVDWAVHRAAGGEMTLACGRLGGCDVGQCKMTGGFDLPAKYIIHAVGPTYSQYTPEKAEQLLKQTYTNCLDMASAHDIRTIAFPALSTGAFGYPFIEGVRAAVEAIHQWQESHGLASMHTTLVAYNAYDYAVMCKEAARHESRANRISGCARIENC